MRYILDSTLLIDWFRGRPQSHVDWLLDAVAAGETLGVCPINVVEVFSGLRPHDYSRWDELLSALQVWPTTLEDGREAGILRYDLARRGIQSSLPDALIAASALRVGATIVTDNTRDFEALGARCVRPGD